MEERIFKLIKSFRDKVAEDLDFGESGEEVDTTDDIENSLNDFSRFLSERVLKMKFRNAFLSDEGVNTVSQTTVGLGLLSQLEEIQKKLNSIYTEIIPKVLDVVKAKE